ncbi:MAG: ribonuclease III domain-containing protein [Clostridiales bacterium]|nr:ribonuclease III domain-containing protein [Clostridiales bacterium]
MEQSVREQFQLEDRDVRSYSSLSLAFLGDAVYELAIRTFLVESGAGKPKQLDRMKKEWVKAQTQAAMAEWLTEKEVLTEEELSVYRRGRNANPATMAKNASMQEYRKATGFECLMAYLYLSGKTSRALELIHHGAEGIGLLGKQKRPSE